MEYQWKYGKRNIITSGWMYPVDNHETLIGLSDYVVSKLFDAHLASSDMGISIDLTNLAILMQKGFVKSAKHLSREWWDFELSDFGHSIMWDCFGRYYIWVHNPDVIIEDATGNIWQHWRNHEDNRSKKL